MSVDARDLTELSDRGEESTHDNGPWLIGYVAGRERLQRASYVVYEYEKLTCGCVDIVGDNVTPRVNVPRITGSRSQFGDKVVPRVVGENTTQRGKDQPMSENSTALGVNTSRYTVCTAYD
jgi:hypothetical protein